MLIILNVKQFHRPDDEAIENTTPDIFSHVMGLWRNVTGTKSICSHGSATYGLTQPEILRDAAEHWNKDITHVVMAAIHNVTSINGAGQTDDQFLKLANASLTKADHWAPTATHAVVIDGKFRCKLTNAVKHDIIDNPEDYVLLNIHVTDN